MEAEHDPIVRAFVPDRTLVARAQREMLRREIPSKRFVRQRWEHALGANRVALDALREIYPHSRNAITTTAGNTIGAALASVTAAYEMLDDLSEDMLGTTMLAVLKGEITTHEQLEERGVPRGDDEA